MPISFLSQLFVLFLRVDLITPVHLFDITCHVLHTPFDIPSFLLFDA
jgi:hypothetical protein